MRSPLVRAVAVLLVWPAGAGAQTISLTEAQALARLTPEHPRVRAARAGTDIARADVLSAGRWPNPRVNWDRQSVAGVTEHYVTVSQPLPITGRRGFDVQAASSLVAASASRADDEVRRLRADLRQACAELLAAQSRERELTAARDRLRTLSDVLARREREGDAAGVDRLRAEREVLDVESEVAVAATERARAQAIVASFLGGITSPSDLMAAGRMFSAAAVPGVDALLERAEEARGVVAAFRHDLDAARFAARSAERSLVPEPEIFVGTKSSTASSTGVGNSLTIGQGAIGPVIAVHATIPLFDRARPERARAAARVAQAEAGADAFRVELRGQVTALRDAVLQRRGAADRYRAEAVNNASEIERIAQVSYEAGERGILDLLDAYRVSSAARLRQAALDLAVRQAEIEREFATGWEAPL